MEYLKKAAKTPETESGAARKVVDEMLAAKAPSRAIRSLALTDGGGGPPPSVQLTLGSQVASFGNSSTRPTPISCRIMNCTMPA